MKEKKLENPLKAILPHQWAINVFHASFQYRKTYIGYEVFGDGKKEIQRSGTTDDKYIDKNKHYIINPIKIIGYNGTVKNPLMLYVPLSRIFPFKRIENNN